MTNALAHRGPDGEGFWQDASGNILFGHRRLCVIDLSEAANQPFHYMDRYTILHNGLIYNYIELREELKKKGYNFRTQTDTEVLVAAYDCWKEECLHQFDGMFAFIIWDEKEREIFGARDRFGEKPFHYINDTKKNAFLFASEIKAFWPLGLGKEFNKRMLFNFLTINYTDNPDQPDETFYEDVKKLPPAHFIRIRYQTEIFVEIKRYWNIDVERKSKIISDKEALGTFKELFQDSIKKRVRNDVLLGTIVSGDLDSSSIVATINELHISDLKTFSAVFPGFKKDEETYIDKVVRQFSLRSFKTSMTNEEIPDLLLKTIRQQDEPFGDASVLSQNRIFELAKNNDVKVILSGQGADEILGGHHKYYKWYWQELFRNRKLFSRGEIKKANALGVKEKFGIKNIIGALLPDFASVVLEKQYLLNALKQEDLSKDFVHLQSKEAYYTPPTIFSLNGALYFNACIHGLEELLRYTDRNSMAHGSDVRSPFLDHKLVEFLFSLPSNFKIRQGWTKWTLRKSMENILPAEITWSQDIMGFEPLRHSWMQLPVVQEMIHESKKKLVDEKVLSPGVLNKKIQLSNTYEDDGHDWKYLVSAPFL